MRNKIFRKEFKKVGIFSGPHKTFGSLTVLVFSGSR
jgi:hypothetical protein